MQKIKFIADYKLVDIEQPRAQSASKSIPEWYKGIPQFINGEAEPRAINQFKGGGNATIKRCSPFLDAFTSGYILELPIDVHIRYVENNTIPDISWKQQFNVLSDHNSEQYPGLPIPDEYVNLIFKWNHFWTIETPKGYSTLFTHPFNRHDLPFQTFSGVVETDAYEMPVQFPFLLKKGFTGIIERGTPVAQLIPFKREAWKSEDVPYDERQVARGRHKLFGKIDRSYKKQFWQKKTYT